MSLCQEQLASNTARGARYRARARRWQKNQNNRRMRRAAKRDPADAPTKKRFRGWP